MSNPPPPLSEDQQVAFDAIKKWFLDTADPVFRLGGLAGTGKTTLIRHLCNFLEPSYNITVASFTGKAVHVLRTKGMTEATTLHNFLFIATKDHNEVKYTFIPRPAHEIHQTALLIVDEASMVDTFLWNTIRSYKHLRVLCVGDHGQLEPVGDNPRLMDMPDVRLEKIHRQAEHNPIIRFAHHLREGNTPPYGEIGNNLRICKRSDSPLFDASWQLICAFNPTRHKVNAICRQTAGYTGLINIGEKVICLRNNPHHKIFNGMMGIITDLYWTRYRGNDPIPVITILTDGGEVRGPIPCIPSLFGTTPEKDVPLRPPYHPDYKVHEFGQFDYGYCITGHKAQGSEWERVVVIEELSRLWNAARWRYTVSTRASNQLLYLTEKGSATWPSVLPPSAPPPRATPSPDSVATSTSPPTLPTTEASPPTTSTEPPTSST